MENSRKMRLLLPEAKIIEIWLGIFRKMLARVLDFVLKEFCEI